MNQQANQPEHLAANTTFALATTQSFSLYPRRCTSVLLLRRPSQTHSHSEIAAWNEHSVCRVQISSTHGTCLMGIITRLVLFNKTLYFPFIPHFAAPKTSTTHRALLPLRSLTTTTFCECEKTRNVISVSVRAKNSNEETQVESSLKQWACCFRLLSAGYAITSS